MKMRKNFCVCGGTRYNALYRIADWNFSNTSEVSTMNKCFECASLFPDLFPTTDSISEAYDNYYTVPIRRKIPSKFLKYILSKLQGSYVYRNTPISANRILDYGCGSGEYLQLVSKLSGGSVCYGTDISNPKEYNSKLPFEWTELDSIGNDGITYDWITLSHVIEHLIDPQQVLSKLHRALTPNGRIWISTPNSRSYLLLHFEGRARDIDFPRHRQVFSQECLTTLLEKSGFHVERILHAPIINCVLNMNSSISNLKRQPFVGKEKRPSIMKAVLGTASYLTGTRPQKIHTSPELIVIAKKA